MAHVLPIGGVFSRPRAFAVSLMLHEMSNLCEE
jgi:hypothetical protein